MENFRIRLRRLKLSDADSLAENAKSREISRYTFLPYPYKKQDAVNFIRICHGKYRKKLEHELGIELKETGKIIGMMGIVHVSEKHQNAEIGYWLGKKYWGDGLAREALELMLKHCFANLKMHRVYAHVMHPNKASGKLLQKCGFKAEGVSRQHIKHRGKWMDMHWFGILEEEYRRLSK